MALTQITTEGIKAGTITGSDLATNVDLVDNQKLRLGNSQDLQIYHSGSHSYIQDSGTGNLRITSDSNIWIEHGSENMIVCNGDGSVELYHDNSKKFETTSTGVQVTGNVNIPTGNNVTTGSVVTTSSTALTAVDNGIAYFGTGLDLRIYHDITNSVLDNQTGHLMAMIPAAKGFRVQKQGGQEDILNAYADASVELFHDGTKKLETSSTGATVTGFITNTAMPRCRLLNPVDEALSGSDNDVNVKFTTENQSVGVSVNNDKDKITILTAGTYFVSTVLAGTKSGSGDSGDGIEIALRRNGGRFLGSSNAQPLDTFGQSDGDEFTFTYACFEDMNVNDEISVTFSNIGDSSATVKRGFLCLVRLG